MAKECDGLTVEQQVSGWFFHHILGTQNLPNGAQLARLLDYLVSRYTTCLVAQVTPSADSNGGERRRSSPPPQHHMCSYSNATGNVMCILLEPELLETRALPPGCWLDGSLQLAVALGSLCGPLSVWFSHRGWELMVGDLSGNCVQ